LLAGVEELVRVNHEGDGKLLQATAFRGESLHQLLVRERVGVHIVEGYWIVVEGQRKLLVEILKDGYTLEASREGMLQDQG
jgi:hypothetical protein